MKVTFLTDDLILDKSSPAELEGTDETYPFPSREWEKRADGTFWMRASGSFEIYPESVVLADTTVLPFVTPEIDSASLVPIFNTTNEEEILRTEAIVATLRLIVEECFIASEGIPIAIETTDETYEKLSEYGYEDYFFEGEIYVEGRWRVE